MVTQLEMVVGLLQTMVSRVYHSRQETEARWRSVKPPVSRRTFKDMKALGVNTFYIGGSEMLWRFMTEMTPHQPIQWIPKDRDIFIPVQTSSILDQFNRVYSVLGDDPRVASINIDPGILRENPDYQRYTKNREKAALRHKYETSDFTTRMQMWLAGSTVAEHRYDEMLRWRENHYFGFLPQFREYQIPSKDDDYKTDGFVFTLNDDERVVQYVFMDDKRLDDHKIWNFVDYPCRAFAKFDVATETCTTMWDPNLFSVLETRTIDYVTSPSRKDKYEKRGFKFVSHL